MAEFKVGNVVYHKATLKRGVIVAGTSKSGWQIKWEDDLLTSHSEAELYTEEEYKDLKQKESPNKESSGGGFMSA